MSEETSFPGCPTCGRSYNPVKNSPTTSSRDRLVPVFDLGMLGQFQRLGKKPGTAI